MKKILAILMMAFMVQTMSAQAPKSRVQRANTRQKASANAMTTRAQISFPTAAGRQSKASDGRVRELP